VGGPRCFKDNLYEHFARLGKALAAPKRLELLDLLCQGPRNVESLAREASLSVANASQHLQVLRAARLVEAERRGLYVEYRVASHDVSRFVVSMRQLAETHLAEIDQATRAQFEQGDDLEPVERAELLRRVRAGEVTVLDVRPVEEFQAGHIPGARSIPIAELKARIAELPSDCEVVAYCRGPWCVMSVEAVELLRANGFAAHRLDLGVPEWRARGWRVEAARARRRPTHG
jgi:rhodanese-related sulfurtransferase